MASASGAVTSSDKAGNVSLACRTNDSTCLETNKETAVIDLWTLKPQAENIPGKVPVKLFVAEFEDSWDSDAVGRGLGDKVLGGLVVRGDERNGAEIHALGDRNDGLKYKREKEEGETEKEKNVPVKI